MDEKLPGRRMEDLAHISVDEEKLKALYGLTKRQARVARMLVDGMKVVEISEALNIPYENAIRHLKNIYTRLDVASQANLTLTLLLSPAATGFPDGDERSGAPIFAFETTAAEDSATEQLMHERGLTRCQAHFVAMSNPANHDPVSKSKRPPFSDFIASLLQNRYGLKRAEARVAALLVCAYRLDQTAEVYGVAYETVRKHLKQTFGKTGTSRQATLVRLFLLDLLVPEEQERKE